MSFLGRILRFLFWALVVSWAVKLLGRAVWGKSSSQPAPAPSEHEAVAGSKRLVKDPICGMHMAEELALPLKADGDVLHFCSEECRAKYESSMMHRAASA